jgi:hypothetical protein
MHIQNILLKNLVYSLSAYFPLNLTEQINSNSKLSDCNSGGARSKLVREADYFD